MLLRLLPLAVLVVTALCLPQQAFAQASNTIPQNNPGAILGGTQNPLTGRPAPGDSQVNPEQEQPDNSDDPAITSELEGKPQLDPSLVVPIQIDRIEVEGNTLLKESLIREIVAPYEGKATPFNVLQEEVAAKITKAYEDAGYVTSAAFIPPQTITGGVLKVQVEEGVVSEVTFEETRWFKSRAVKPRLLTDEGNAFKVQDLIKDIRRINENPDLTLAATLRAGEKPGETQVVLRNTQKETLPIHFTPFFDNLGRDTIGELRTGFVVNANNVTGFGDTLFSSHAWSREAYSTVNGYELPVGEHGTKLGVTHGTSVFDFQTGGARFKGQSNIVNGYVKQEFFRGERLKVEGELGFAVKNSKTRFNGIPNSEDKLRVLTQAINVEQFDRTGRTFMRHELAEGFDLFGATLGTENTRDYAPSRPGAGSQFFRYTASAIRSQRVIGPTYAIFKALGQVTPDPLVSLEQFQMGGAATVRGYSEGRFIGDSGFVLSAEYRIPLFFLPETWTIPRTEYRFRDAIELVSFLEGGGVFDNETGLAGSAGVNAQRGQVLANAYALGAGVGVRARLTQYINFRMDVGFPLIRAIPDRETARLHFGLESRFF